MFENLKKTFNMGKSVLDSTQQFAQNVNNITQGPGLFGLAGTPQQTNEIAQQNYPYQEQASYPQATIAPVQATFAAPIEQVEKNLRQEAKINARRICSVLRQKGVTMRVLFTMVVKDLDEEKKLEDYEKENDLEEIDEITDLPDEIRVALQNKMKLKEFTKLTTNIEEDLLELLEDTLFQKYRLEYMAGKHQMISEMEIISMYTTIMTTPIYELGADMLVDKALKYKKPALEYGKQLLEKFTNKKT
ncbi:MAG: hypothetical protein ACOVQ4_05290 [Flectobacillus sp.]|uniref:hypothetical protein n=1 Tax=Flectobacillus sp. TaxID=50419 RepID=UPI003B99E0ED